MLLLCFFSATGLLRTATGWYSGEKITDIFNCNLQFGIHVGLHCVILRVCRIFWYCSLPSDDTRALPPPALELAVFALQKKSGLFVFSSSVL